MLSGKPIEKLDKKFYQDYNSKNKKNSFDLTNEQKKSKNSGPIVSKGDTSSGANKRIENGSENGPLIKNIFKKSTLTLLQYIQHCQRDD